MLRAVLLWLVLLAGCASVPPVQPVMRPADAEQKPFVLDGRISIKHDGKRSSASVRWNHHGGEDDILLLAPFGQTVARIHSDAQGVVLDTQDRHYSAQDTEELTVRALGWSLPLAGLRYWALALPAPGSPADIERDTGGRMTAMRQDGWDIRYTRYAAEASGSLPLRIALQREGMELLLLVDAWEFPGGAGSN